MKTATVLAGGLTALLDNPNIKPAESEYYKRKSEGISWGDYLYKKWSDFESQNQPINIIYNGELKEGQVVSVGEPINQYYGQDKGISAWYNDDNTGVSNLLGIETRIAYPVISVIGEKEQSKRKCVAGNFLCDACHYPKCDCRAIDASNEVKEEGDNWIRVEDKYPPIGEIILVYRPDNTQDIMFCDGLGATWFTHWQPLPNPPKNK